MTSRLSMGLSTALALLTCLATPVTGQDQPARQLHRPMEFVAGQDDNLFSLRRSQEDIYQWELGLTELEAGEHTAAVERLHRLLQNESGGVTPVAPGRFLGLRLAVIMTLANMSPAAKQAYDTLVQREAGHLAERPLHTLLPAQLELLARRYPTSRPGLHARIRLGDLALERGAGSIAAGHYRQALDATAIGSQQEQSLVARRQAARTLIEPRRARAEAAEQRLPPAAAEVLEVMSANAEDNGWFAVGGGSNGRSPMSPPAGEPTPSTAEAVFALGFQRRESGLYAMAPVGDLDGIYVNTGRELKAFDPLRNSMAWESLSPLRDGERDYGPGEQGSVNHDMVLSAACGDGLVVAPLQVPERSANVDFHNNFRILTKIPQRRLFCFSRSTGKLVWSHFDALDGPRSRRFRGHDVCGPPLISGDTVYVPIHDRAGAIAFSVAAYDLATGNPKWRRLVCSSQQEVNMFGNARMEFAASPLCLNDGVIYGASNLGVAFAIDASAGETRWVGAYDVVRMPTASLRRQRDRAVYFMNNAPVVTDGVVCLTPLDSPYVLGIDCETGGTLWRISADAPVDGIENDVRWLCGVLDDEFILTGRGAVAVKARPRGQVFALDAESRQLVPPQTFRPGQGGPISGRPAVTADRVWVANRGSITAYDRAGNVIEASRQIRQPRYEGGRLLFVDGIVVSLRLGALEIFLDRGAVLAQVEERYLLTPDDPAAILRLATLRSALLPATATTKERQLVTDLYRKGLQACLKRGLQKSHPIRRALQSELFEQAMAAAAAATHNGDPRVFELLAEARATAPDTRAWLQVQQLVLDQCGGDEQLLATELDRLEKQAAGAMMILPDGKQPVRAYVLYRRAQLTRQPAATVAIWQQLLEHYPTSSFDGATMANRASAAIAALIREHGKACYAAIDQRADAALQAAGDDAEALRTIGLRFPNSRAAAKARTRVLDGAVARGEIGIACEVLALELRRDDPDPRVLRRVLVAAQKRGNLGLARAMADRLTTHADEVSDWPGDAGATYAEVLAGLAPTLQTKAPKNDLGVPRYELTRIRPRTPRESFRLVPVIEAEGFTRPPDAPLYAVAGADLMAIDIHQNKPPILFALPVQFLEHVVLCGTTLVVPDLERIFGIDYRTGEVRWRLPEKDGYLLDGLGVQSGVLHLSAQPSDGEGAAEFLGLEPLSGRVLFERALSVQRMRPVPKPIDGQLLVMRADTEGRTSLQRLEAVSGRTLQVIELAESLPRTEGLATRIYPQGLCGDADRVYLPVDSTFSGDAPRVFAVTDDGAVDWSWQGNSNSRLLMAALRGDRMVVVEGSEEQRGRVTILRASDGHVLQTVPLGHDIDVLNWQRGWLPNPAPAALLLSDLATPSGRERRFFCIGIDEGMPSFAETLNSQHGEAERQPQLGADFLTFGIRPSRQGPFRLYSLNLADRSGALPGGQKYLSLRIDPTYALTAVGPYTVLCCAEYLVVLGPEERIR